MPALPWKRFRATEVGRDYIVLLSELPLNSYLAIPRFLRLTRQVQCQLSWTPGLLGYSLFARIGRKQFWTLSVWEDEEALMAFVEAVPHRTVMKALQPHLGPTRFLRWSITSDAYPPTWEDAFAQAAAQSADYPPSFS